MSIGAIYLSIACPERPSKCPRLAATSTNAHRIIAAIEETDNYRANQTLACWVDLPLPQEPDGHEVVLADKFTASLKLLRLDTRLVSGDPLTCGNARIFMLVQDPGLPAHSSPPTEWPVSAQSG